MDNASGSLQAGALQLSETLSGIKALHACMHWNGISKAHTPSVLKQSSLKCFRDAPPYLAHCCFILKAVLVRFDGDGIIHGNSAFCC